MNNVLPPPPQGHYVPARRFGDLIFISGMTPRQDGELLHIGRVSAGAAPENYEAAAELATNNALQAARSQLSEGETLDVPVSLTVYINAATDFTSHSKIADFCSAVIAKAFRGQIASRAAVGVSSLPGGAVLEVSLVAGIGPRTAPTAYDAIVT